MLMEADPSYKASLEALPLVDRERLLGGNWKIREAAGLIFRRDWFGFCEANEVGKGQAVRSWDLAATQGGGDWTVGVKIVRVPDPHWWIVDVIRFQGSPRQVRDTIVNTAAQDGPSCHIRLPQDPGQAGKAQAQDLVAALEGYQAKAELETGDKVTRAKPLSAQVEAGNVTVVRGPWTDIYVTEMENFPSDHLHDDQVDASSGGFNHLAKQHEWAFR